MHAVNHHLKELISAINYNTHMEAIHQARSTRLLKEAKDEYEKAHEAARKVISLDEELHQRLFSIMLRSSTRKFLKLLHHLGL